MVMARLFFPTLVWSLMLVCAVGCRQNSKSITVDSPTIRVEIVQLHADSDSLFSMPDDTAFCDGWASVKDNYGDPVPEMRVQLILTGGVGFIEYTNAHLRDTTDATGRTFFRYVACNHWGRDTIIARVDNVQATWPLVVAERQAGTIHLTIPDTASIGCPVAISVSVLDARSVPIAGVPVAVSCFAEPIITEPPLMLTDSNGVAHGTWRTHSAGQYMMHAEALGRVGDSAMVTVQAGEPWTMIPTFDSARTISYSAEDTVFIDGVVRFFDGSGNRIPGPSLRFSLKYPWGRLEVIDSTRYRFWSVGDTNTHQEIRVTMPLCAWADSMEAAAGQFDFVRCFEGAGLRVSVSPDTIRTDYLSNAQAQVTAMLSGCYFLPSRPLIRFDDGQGFQSQLRTDSTGKAVYDYWPRQFGRTTLTVAYESFSAFTFLVVIDTSGTPE
jgi:hypothetical protein